jgi:hypothetical protein
VSLVRAAVPFLHRVAQPLLFVRRRDDADQLTGSGSLLDGNPLIAVVGKGTKGANGLVQLKSLRQSLAARNGCDQRLATRGLSTPPDFIASPLHRLVRLRDFNPLPSL